MNKWPIPAVAAVVIRDGSILLIQRGDEPSRGKWSIPGGRVEWGETLTDAVKREVKEETGLDVTVGDVAAVFDMIVHDDEGIAFHYVIIDYFAESSGGTLTPGDDAADARWVPFEDLDKYELTDHLKSRLAEMGIEYRP
ncbi:MAG: NUDIX hydrolase [Armatimonadota bacterium]